MKKLRLDVEKVRVEPFELAAAGDGERGTVRAHSPHTVPDCSALTCFVSCAVESCTHLCC
jgi:hypothetical protein